jgi:uncharacterized protein YjcR
VKDLSDKQRRAAQLLVGGMIGREVAVQVQVTPETISTWKKSHHFQAYANALRNESLQATIDAIRGKCFKAVETLGTLAEGATTEETRRKASVDLLRLMGVLNQKTYQQEAGPESAIDLLLSAPSLGGI